MLPVVCGVATAAISVVAVLPENAAAGGMLGVLGVAGGVASFTLGRRPRPEPKVASTSPLADAIDEDSGLPGLHLGSELLRREIARSERYGDRGFLAVVAVETSGFRPAVPGDTPPSYGKHVASVLRGAMRQTDTVMRLDPRHFAILLTECDTKQAEIVVGRLRTQLGTTPFARNADGSGVYLRAWCGGVGWQPELNTPGLFLRAAGNALVIAHTEYESAQQWFKGHPKAS